MIRIPWKAKKFKRSLEAYEVLFLYKNEFSIPHQEEETWITYSYKTDSPSTNLYNTMKNNRQKMPRKGKNIMVVKLENLAWKKLSYLELLQTSSHLTAPARINNQYVIWHLALWKLNKMVENEYTTLRFNIIINLSLVFLRGWMTITHKIQDVLVQVIQKQMIEKQNKMVAY